MNSEANIDRIIGKRIADGVIQYMVRWARCLQREDSWESFQTLGLQNGQCSHFSYEQDDYTARCQAVQVNSPIAQKSLNVQNPNSQAQQNQQSPQNEAQQHPSTPEPMSKVHPNNLRAQQPSYISACQILKKYIPNPLKQRLTNSTLSITPVLSLAITTTAEHSTEQPAGNTTARKSSEPKYEADESTGRMNDQRSIKKEVRVCQNNRHIMTSFEESYAKRLDKLIRSVVRARLLSAKVDPFVLHRRARQLVQFKFHITSKPRRRRCKSLRQLKAKQRTDNTLRLLYPQEPETEKDKLQIESNFSFHEPEQIYLGDSNQVPFLPQVASVSEHTDRHLESTGFDFKQQAKHQLNPPSRSYSESPNDCEIVEVLELKKSQGKKVLKVRTNTGEEFITGYEAIRHSHPILLLKFYRQKFHAK